jgi:hypothetical protein
MVAFIVSLVITALMVGVFVVVAKRRPVGQPMTWGEAFVAAAFMFVFMVMLYGVVPNQWLAWADNELGWRSDNIGIPNPFGKPWFRDGLDFGGRGRIEITAETIRDVIASVIYGIGLVGQVLGWLWWQRRGKRAARPAELPTSAYGRPLVRKV